MEPASEVSRRSRSRTPWGPLTTTSARAASAVCSEDASRPAASPGPGRGGRARLERLEVAEVVAGEKEPPASNSAASCWTGHPLSMPDERTSITLRPGSTTSPCSVASSSMRRQQPVDGQPRVVQPAGVDRDGEPLLLDVRRRGVMPAQHRRQLTLEGREAVRRPRRDDPALGGRPALVAVLPEDEQLLAVVPISAPTSSRSPSASAWRAGRPVITAIARTSSASSTRTSCASGWMRASEGSSTIGESTPSKSRPTTVQADGADELGVPLFGLGGGELHAPIPP